MSPWRAYLLLMQDHARRTGTYGEMISSDLHGAKIPLNGCCDPSPGAEGHQRLAPEKEKDVPPEILWQAWT
jgi:hypothetical protein